MPLECRPRTSVLLEILNCPAEPIKNRSSSVSSLPSVTCRLSSTFLFISPWSRGCFDDVRPRRNYAFVRHRLGVAPWNRWIEVVPSQLRATWITEDSERRFNFHSSSRRRYLFPRFSNKTRIKDRTARDNPLLVYLFFYDRPPSRYNPSFGEIH